MEIIEIASLINQLNISFLSRFLNELKSDNYQDCKIFYRKNEILERREILNFYICNLIIIISKRIMSE